MSEIDVMAPARTRASNEEIATWFDRRDYENGVRVGFADAVLWHLAVLGRRFAVLDPSIPAEAQLIARTAAQLLAVVHAWGHAIGFDPYTVRTTEEIGVNPRYAIGCASTAAEYLMPAAWTALRHGRADNTAERLGNGRTWLVRLCANLGHDADTLMAELVRGGNGPDV